MSQQIPRPPKKVVSRNVAIALGIICIILVGGLVGAIANYTSQISSVNSQFSNLKSQANDLSITLNLGKGHCFM